MARDLAWLRDRVYLRAGVSTTDGQLTTVAVNECVNDAISYIATIHDWPWQRRGETTFNTVAGTAEYAPPADWLRTMDVRVMTPNPGRGMTLYGAGELDDRWVGIQGQPRDYATETNLLRLAPTPDGVYSIRHRYIVLESELAVDGDQPLMPPQFRPAIAEYAAVLALRRISEESPRATVCQAAFDRWVLVLHQDRRRSTAPMRIRVRDGSLIV